MEMAFCNEHGIPHSEFLDWDPEDRAKAMAFVAEYAIRCQLCGTAKWEWDENKFAFTAVEEFCQGCYQKQVFSDQQGSSLPGTNVKLIPTTPRLNAQMALKARKRSRLKMD
jgi:hypothetical protein